MYPALDHSHRRITVRLRSPNAEFLGHHPNRGVSEEDFLQIAERFPAYKASKSRVELMLPMGHPDLFAFGQFAKSLNLVVEPDSKAQSQVEILDYTKHAAADVAASRYVECGLFEPTFGCAVEINGGLGMGFSSKELVKYSSQEFGSIPNLPHLIVVRGEVKKHIEASKLIGLDLMQLSTDLDGGEWPNESEPLFLIWSSVIFPGVISEILSTKLGCRLVDGYEVRPQLIYTDDFPKTDVGLTHELFGANECYRRIIYSAKAMSVLEEIGMKLECVPVRVVDKRTSDT